MAGRKSDQKIEEKDTKKEPVFKNLACGRCGHHYPLEVKDKPYQVRFECSNCKGKQGRSEYITGTIRPLKQ